QTEVQGPGGPSVDVRAGLHFVLHLAGFLGSTLLMTWGLFALFFLTIGGFSLDGLMNQLNNLTTRYVVATPERVASFKTIFAVAHLILAAGIIVLRRERILPQARSQGEPRHG
ncbi:hypothetical protein DAH81_24480, partial [Sphingomonas koreensis]|uniref:hypothetical protein n=1 Tax=Sphingomonas koreensis TaxID=93064 RepID=UPI000F7E0CC8